MADDVETPAVPAAPKYERNRIGRERFGSRRIIKYSPQLSLIICEKVALGKTLTEICEADEMPSRVSFWRWMMLHKDVRAAYQAARELSAQSLEDEALTIARDLKEKNEYTATKVRSLDIAMQQFRWSASRRDPARYGQSAEKSITVPIQINTTLDLGGESGDGQGIYTITAKVEPPDGKDLFITPEKPERGIIPRNTSKKATK